MNIILWLAATHSLDGVVSLHGSQQAVVEDGHEEALCQVVQVLPHRQHVVALAPGARVEPASLHARTEAADGGTLWQ